MVLTALFIFLLGLQRWTSVAGQDCTIESPPPVTISETDPPQELLHVTGGPTANWSFRVLTHSQYLDPYFRLEQGGGNATLSLKKTLDLETIFGQLGQIVNNIRGSLSCSQAGPTSVPDVVYEWYAFVQPVNEFAPEFVDLPAGGFDISEDTRVGDIVFVLENYVNDTDVVPNQMGYDFTFIPYSANPQVDGRDVFSVQESLTGSTVLSSALDYEAMEPGRAFYILHVMVADRDDTTSLTSSGTVRINVIDADDQPPEFWYPGCKSPCFTSYSAPIRTDFVGQVTWLEPDAIQARDRDTLDSPVTFSIKQGDPKYYTDYISIDPQTGVPSVIKEVESAETASFLVIVEALETTDRGHSEQTTLWLVIEGRNLSIPSLPTSTSSGEPFRIATIVLGCLFGLILILFIVFVVLTTVAVKKKTMPVLPRAIGKLSADTTTTTSENRSTRESYRSDREADTSGNRSSAGRKLSRDSGVDFLRSLSSPSAMGPALRPGSFLRTEQECETLPANDEIDYVNSATRQRNSRLSTTSASEVVPYPERRVSTVSRSAAQNEDRVGLVGNLSEEVMGLANPVYGLQGQQQHEDRAVDVGVVPMEQVEVRI